MIMVLIVLAQIMLMIAHYEYSKELTNFNEVIDSSLTLITIVLLGIFFEVVNIVRILKNNKKGG